MNNDLLKLNISNHELNILIKFSLLYKLVFFISIYINIYNSNINDF